MSEENTDSHHLSAGQRFFLVDPLDGTKEFIKADDYGALPVNIGLIENGLPVMGMVYAPARNAFIGGIKARCILPRDHAHHPYHCAPSTNRGAVAVASASHLDAATTNWQTTKSIKPHRLGHRLNLRLSHLGRLMSIRDLGQPWNGIRRLVMYFVVLLAEWFFILTAKYITLGKRDYRNTPFIAAGQLTPSAMT